jgi:hypothetical protein
MIVNNSVLRTYVGHSNFPDYTPRVEINITVQNRMCTISFQKH